MSKHNSMPPVEMSREEIKMKAMSEVPAPRTRFHQHEVYRGYDQRMPDNAYAKNEHMPRNPSGQGYVQNMENSMQNKYDYERYHQMQAEHDRKLAERYRMHQGAFLSSRVSPISQNADYQYQMMNKQYFQGGEYQQMMHQGQNEMDALSFPKHFMFKILDDPRPKYPGLSRFEKEEIRLNNMRKMHTLKKIHLVYTGMKDLFDHEKTIIEEELLKSENLELLKQLTHKHPESFDFLEWVEELQNLSNLRNPQLPNFNLQRDYDSAEELIK